jgi:Na+-translocating ferredoxin:NAD+ oxidoreductase RNF subunit RnfB
MKETLSVPAEKSRKRAFHWAWMVLPLARAGFLPTVHGICQVAGVLTIMPLSDYLGRKKTVLLSNFSSPSLRKGCEMCIDRCGMGAISMEDNVAVINHDRCIGCGVCGAVCVNDAHRMHKKDTPHIPPKTHNDMYKKIMIERFGLVNTLRTVSRVLTGRKT